MLTTQAQVNNFPIQYPNCDSLPGSLYIGPSADIADLTPLRQLRWVYRSVVISDNADLTTLAGLDSLFHLAHAPINNFTKPDSLAIQNNDRLRDLRGLGNPATRFGKDVDLKLVVADNDSLLTLEGLEAYPRFRLVQRRLRRRIAARRFDRPAQSPTRQFARTARPDRRHCGHFGQRPTGYGGDLHVESNPFLTSLSGLDNLASTGESLYISDNPFLTSLSGLDNINPATITGLFIGNNLQLILCDVQSVCNYLENGGTATVFGNAPGCNSVAEIEAACIVSIEETSTGLPVVTFFPNPASDFLQIQVSDNEKWEISLFDLQGRLLRRQSLTAGQMLDVQGLAAGMYALKVVVGERVYVGRFVKQ